MLRSPEDAEDAPQEALIRIMTRIDSYRGEAAFTTWVAANLVLSVSPDRSCSRPATARLFLRGWCSSVLTAPGYRAGGSH